MAGFPRFSIVVNTNGRCKSLKQTLDSFLGLDYPNFEVCVVYGPAEDGTREMAEDMAARGLIKARRCAEFNLSISRNIGIALASGEMVAFIDDDAVPEPEWLSGLASGYDDPYVGGVGGFTYDHTGYTYQARYILCDRFGDAALLAEDPGVADHCFPFSRRYPSLMGTNSSFRRDALVEIGGFDEEFEYYLDETDVCLRLVDRGYLIKELAGAAVYHKFLPSHLRNEHRFLSTPFPVMKNKVYFALCNAHGHHGVDEAIRNIQAFFEVRRNEMVWGVDTNKVPSTALEVFDEQVDRAWAIGLSRGLSGVRRTRAPEFFRTEEPFLPFRTRAPAGDRRTIVLLSQDYPPAHVGGVVRYTHDMARAIAASGHNVHVLTRGSDFDRVDLEEGVWVHRLVDREYPVRRLADGHAIPQHIWNHSATLLDEARRIQRSRRIDAVEGVSWDCETAAFVLEGEFPIATNVVTSLANWLDTHVEQRVDEGWMRWFGKPMLALERMVFAGSDRIVAASEAILDSLSQTHAIAFGKDRVLTCPHALMDMRDMPRQRPQSLAPKAESAGSCVILFVGRLELRKGIDTLLEAAGVLLPDRPSLQFWIAGDDTVDIGGGTTAREQFLSSEVGKRCGHRTRFLGKVSDEELRWLYANCDILAAPSRFESFGLILVEAMMFSKPVVGGRAGGMMEIVDDGCEGMLVEPGDIGALVEVLGTLVDNGELRARMGEAGRTTFERRFFAHAVAPERVAALAGIDVRPLGPSAALVEGSSDRVEIGGEIGLSLGERSAVSLKTAGRVLSLTFLTHEWSGIARVAAEPGEEVEIDLYSPWEGRLTTQVAVQETPGRVRIARTGKRNPAARNCEVVVVAARQA